MHIYVSNCFAFIVIYVGGAVGLGLCTLRDNVLVNKQKIEAVLHTYIQLSVPCSSHFTYRCRVSIGTNIPTFYICRKLYEMMNMITIYVK